MPWESKEKDAVVKAVAIVCELTGTQFSEAAQLVMLRQLAVYPSRQVLAAIERCAVEVKGRLTLPDIVQRLDDGRPGVEEAWAMMPKAEQDAGCVTDEMSEAWGAAAHLYSADQIGARMAFKESYLAALTRNRRAAVPTKWRVSAGWDKASTEAAAIEGLKAGRLSEGEALQYILPEKHEQALYIAGKGPRPLQLPESAVQRAKELVAGVLKRLDANRNPPPPQEAGDRD